MSIMVNIFDVLSIHYVVQKVRPLLIYRDSRGLSLMLTLVMKRVRHALIINGYSFSTLIRCTSSDTRISSLVTIAFSVSLGISRPCETEIRQFHVRNTASFLFSTFLCVAYIARAYVV